MKRLMMISMIAVGFFALYSPGAGAMPVAPAATIGSLAAPPAQIVEIGGGPKSFKAKRNNGRRLGWTRGRGNPHHSVSTAGRSYRR